MDEYIEIKKVDFEDIIILQKIGKETFLETFSAENDNSNIEKYLDHSFSLKKLETELKNKESLFYFAVLDDYVVGYLKLNLGNSQTGLQDKKSLEIERIYVLQEFQGKQIGHLFYEKAIEVALNMKVDYIWLGVWEKNLKAINFYKKKRFVEFDQHIFKLGDDEQTDIMMKLYI